MKLPPVKRGDTWKFVFVWKNDNTPINLSNCTARMQVRKRRVGTLLAEVSTESGDIVIVDTEGRVEVSFPASATSDVEPGIHETDLQVTFNANGDVKSSNTMQITVEEDITR